MSLDEHLPKLKWSAVTSLAIAGVLALSTWYKVRCYPDTPAFPAILLWMLAVWLPWIPLSLLVFRLSKSLPLRSRRWFTLPSHLLISCLLTLCHWAYFLLLSSRLSPFLGLPDTTYGAYAFFFLFWIQLDLLLYWAHLGFATVRSSEADLRNRERQASELQVQIVESQLQALKLQIQPHFLFNTLNTVVAMQRTGEIEKATRMTVALSELLRLLLASGEAQEVPLSRELELLDRYLEIERFRFEDRLVVDEEVEDGLRDASVPTLLLQPLVENAIRHGVAIPARRKIVSLEIHRNGDRLVIEVTNETRDHEASNEGFGIGLRNLQQRLAGLYATNHRFSSRVEAGRFKVEAEIPLHWVEGGGG